MDLKRLRTFVAVADLGTVSRAALRLRTSQSALSRQISELEYECGFKLFDRIGRRLFLTTRGEQLLGDPCCATAGWACVVTARHRSDGHDGAARFTAGRFPFRLIARRGDTCADTFCNHSVKLNADNLPDDMPVRSSRGASFIWCFVCGL